MELGRYLVETLLRTYHNYNKHWNWRNILYVHRFRRTHRPRMKFDQDHPTQPYLLRDRLFVRWFGLTEYFILEYLKLIWSMHEIWIMENWRKILSRKVDSIIHNNILLMHIFVYLLLWRNYQMYQPRIHSF